MFFFTGNNFRAIFLVYRPQEPIRAIVKPFVAFFANFRSGNKRKKMIIIFEFLDLENPHYPSITPINSLNLDLHIVNDTLNTKISNSMF